MDDTIRRIKNPELSAEVVESLDGATLLDPDALDVAIIAARKNDSDEVVAVYDYDKLVIVFKDQLLGEDCDIFGAQEWVDFNTLGALHGSINRCPWVVSVLEDNEYALDENPTTVAIGDVTYLRLAP